MSVYFTVSGAGQPEQLAALQQAIMDHATFEAWFDHFRINSYSVDLAGWNPNRKDWANDEGGFTLEACTDGEGQEVQPLVVIEGDKLMVDGLVDGDGPVPVHFLSGLHELHPGVALTMDAVLNHYNTRIRWAATDGQVQCVEKVAPCWDSEQVRYWMRDGKVLIRHGRPMADEVAHAARFIVVHGHPVAEGEGELQPVQPYLTGNWNVKTAFVTDRHAVSAYIFQW